MTPSLPHTYSAGDLRPDISGSFNFSIAGHAITLRILRPDGTLLVKPAIIDDDGSVSGVGLFHFEFAAGNIQAGLRQTCEVRDVDASARALTSPQFFLNVRSEMVAIP